MVPSFPDGRPAALVDALAAVCDDRAFWRTLERPDVSGWEPAELVLRADDERLDRIAEAFARVIDAKSPYTARHSERVARDRRRPALRRRRAARPAPRRPPARRRQARDLQPDPRQARAADRGRVRARQGAPGVLARDPRAGAVLRRDRAACRKPPRADRRQRLPARAARRGARPADARARGRRRLQALTAERPYREALPVERALAIVAEDVPGRLDGTALAALETYAGTDPLAPGMLTVAEPRTAPQRRIASRR